MHVTHAYGTDRPGRHRGRRELLSLARRARLLLPLVLAVLCASWAPAGAGHGILEALDVREAGEGTEVRVEFAVRVQYVTHAPASRGRILVINFRVIDPLSIDSFDIESRDSLRPSRSAALPLSEVAYEGDGSGNGRLTF
jgi:hypothetical protein